MKLEIIIQYFDLPFELLKLNQMNDMEEWGKV
jgi:hypothetical protein